MSGIDDVCAGAVARGDVFGLVVAAASRDGIMHQAAYGLREAGGGTPMSLDTTFRLHSMTKAITATAAMQLVERGVLDLDAPLDDLLPGLARKQVLTGFDPAGLPLLRPARGAITLRQLLTHTAGFSYDIWNANTLRYQKETGFPGPFTGTNAALGQPLSFDPGDRWHYSIGLDWAGKAVEAASGLDLETYFRRHILDPLGMVDTTFVQNEEQRARRVAMHRRMADGSLASFVLDRPERTEYFVGGGGLFGTVPDYLAFTRALLAGGGPILAPETVAMMAENHIGDLNVEPMASQIPASSHSADFWPGMVQKWGLSFLINTEETPQGRSAGSLAWAGLSNLYYWIDLKKGVTGVFATQLLPFFDARAVETFRAFETQVYRETKLPGERAPRRA